MAILKTGLNVIAIFYLLGGKLLYRCNLAGTSATLLYRPLSSIIAYVISRFQVRGDTVNACRKCTSRVDWGILTLSVTLNATGTKIIRMVITVYFNSNVFKYVFVYQMHTMYTYVQSSVDHTTVPSANLYLRRYRHILVSLLHLINETVQVAKIQPWEDSDLFTLQNQ